MKFIRKGGRIIPIRSSQEQKQPQSDRHHLAFAGAGLAHKISESVGNVHVATAHVGDLKIPIFKQKKFAAAVSGTIGLGILAGNVSNSYKHGISEHSFNAGIKRFGTNWLAKTGGKYAGGKAIKGLPGAIKSAAKPKGSDIIPEFRRIK